MRMKLILPVAALLSGNLIAVEPTSHEDPIIVNGNSVHINMRTRTMNLPSSQVLGETKLFQHMHRNGNNGMRRLLVFSPNCKNGFLCSETPIGPTDLVRIQVKLQDANGTETTGAPIEIKQETIPGFVSPAHDRAQHELKEKIHWLNVKRKIFFFCRAHFDKELAKRRQEQKEFEHVWTVSTKTSVIESPRSKEALLDPGDDSGEVRKFDYVPQSGLTAWPTAVSIVRGGNLDPQIAPPPVTVEEVAGTARFGQCYIVEVDHWVDKSDTISKKLHSHVQMLINKNGQFPYCTTQDTPVAR